MKKTVVGFVVVLFLCSFFLIVQGSDHIINDHSIKSSYPLTILNHVAGLVHRIDSPGDFKKDGHDEIMPYDPWSLPYNQQDIIIEKHITIISVGDIMAHTIQLEAARKTDGYDFDSQFLYIKEKISSKDFAIANLETVFAGEEAKYSGANMIFNTPDALAESLKNAGFDIITTANNHSLDRGFSGISRTIDVLDQLALMHTGTYKNIEDSQKILTFEKEGVTFALLSYSYSTNGWPLPVEHANTINMMDEEKILSDIKKAKSEGVDMVLVAVHWGVEYQLHPNNHQVTLANKMFYAGADIILGTHPHVLQPFEHKKMVDVSGLENDKFIIYSQGNFVSGQRTYPRAIGMYITFDVVKKGDEKPYINMVSCMPTYVENTFKNGKRVMRVLDTHTAQLLDSDKDGLTPDLLKLLYLYEHEFIKHLSSKMSETPYLNNQLEYVIYEKNIDLKDPS